MGRAGALFVDWDLRRDHLTRALGSEAAPADKAVDLDLARDPHEDDGWKQPLQLVFEQQRNVLNDDVSASLQRLGAPLGHPVAHEWMDYLVQPAARVRVFEDQLAQRLPVDTPIAHVAVAKLANYCCESRRFGLVNSVARLVRVDYLGAELSQHGGDCRFPRTDAPCESHELHHLRCCINGRRRKV